MPNRLLIDLSKPPKVLFLGNGVLKLDNKGVKWDDLIKSLNPDFTDNLKDIPMAMRPEAVSGTDAEEVQRKTAALMENGIPHEILKQLAAMDFDAILTTNYTYEIEEALSGARWSTYSRKKAHTTLHDKPGVHHNTYKCNIVRTKDGRELPVFHVHGEKDRKHSLVLSYYSYANSVYRLVEMNKQRGNSYAEKQEAGNLLECHGWLDYFLLGDVYAVGFGFDFSEFDIWWALERKSREKAVHGQLHAYMIDSQQDTAKSIMLKSMDVDERFIQVEDGIYLKAYEQMLDDLKKTI